MIKASIIGANGYTGEELMNLLSVREDVTLSHLVSRSNAGTKVTDCYPSLVELSSRRFEDLDEERIAADSDVAFCCLPHAASSEICAKLFHRGVKIIDLSADFRYRDLAVYEAWYKVKHFEPALLKKAVYGLSEIYADEIKKADIVGNPGCYTTCSILPLYPLLQKGLVESRGIVIDAKSGTTGAGRKAELSNIFTEVNENFKAYAVTTHRHTSEIEEQLSIAAKTPVTLNFTPHLLPVQRGILATIYCDLTGSVEDVFQAYTEYYGEKKFVRVLENGALPELKYVTRSNYCMIGVKHDARTGKLILVSCLDNLVKGASGQAVQNMNLMFGLSEDAGLTAQARYV